jgi:hypothetical protein
MGTSQSPVMITWGTGLTGRLGLGGRLDEILFLDEQLECQISFLFFSFSFVNTKHLHIQLRAGSHYGRPSREAVRLSGQTLLRVQRNELKITNKI